jgi:hypothetical protein
VRVRYSNAHPMLRVVNGLGSFDCGFASLIAKQIPRSG